MKKGFTMIELIFVIVILGILAAIAIPKLTATRNDAIVVSAAQEAKTVLDDLGRYYTSQGDFKTDIKNITNVKLEAKAVSTGLNSAFNKSTGNGDLVYKIKDVDCVGYSLTNSDGNVTVTANPITSNDDLCVQLYSMLDFNGTTYTFGGKKIKW